MPRRPKWRPARRRPQDRSEEIANQQQRMDAAARGLLANNTPDQLRSVLHDRQLMLDEADRAAQTDPNPANLAQYRAARANLETVRRALELSGRESQTGS